MDIYQQLISIIYLLSNLLPASVRIPGAHEQGLQVEAEKRERLQVRGVLHLQTGGAPSQGMPRQPQGTF